jgi:hypothetical protein
LFPKKDPESGTSILSGSTIEIYSKPLYPSSDVSEEDLNEKFCF